MHHEEDFTTPLKAKQRETTKRARDSNIKNMAEKAGKRAIIVTDGQVVAAKAAPAVPIAGADEETAADDAKAAEADEAAGDDAKAADAKAAAPGPAVATAKAKGGGGKGNKGNK